MTTQKRFFTGVLLLAFSNMLVKATGLLFKIPLTHLLGEIGMGYFNAAYTIYAWFYMLTTAGLSVAVSMLVSESRARANIKQIKIIVRTVLVLFFAIGLVGTLMMVFGAKWLAEAISVPEASICIMAIAPSLFFSCMSSALRGYFQGYQIMLPTAVSQLMEALGKLFIGIAIAKYTLSLGMTVEEVAAYALLGIAIGVAAGFLFLCLSKFIFNENKYNGEYSRLDGDELEVLPSRKVAARLISIALPITISSSVMSLTSIFDTLFMTNGLMKFGLTNAEAVKVYGNYTSLAVPMFNLPPVLIYSITYSVVPMISAAFARHEADAARGYMRSSLKMTSLIALPCSVGLGVLSYPILSMFFSREMVENGAGMLSALSVSIYFVCMLAMTNALLQASSHEKLPIISMASGALVKLAGSLILIPLFGKYGTPISTFLCYLTIVAINMVFVAQKLGVVPSVADVYLKPAAAGALCGVTAMLSYHLLSGIIGMKLSTLIAIVAAAAVYIAAVLCFRLLEVEDIMILPKSGKILTVLEKLHAVKR